MFPFIGVSSHVKEAHQIKAKGVTLSHGQVESINKYNAQLKSFFAASIDFLKWAQGVRVSDVPFYQTAILRLLCIGNVRSLRSFREDSFSILVPILLEHRELAE